MTAQLIALHLGGVPEVAMFLGPILLIVAFVRIARRNDEAAADDEDDWDADLGDLPTTGRQISESSPGSRHRS
ncbi:hypothetical protein [Kribbella sp. CA-293567]|uniref:hypothetical protein n=1 Tax=Kribbella sp. CA-293567 TaxID=3002436 RepID=UPI0022DD365D|nr:hypothetical protein [Kribbella sp. CA-293567]WBQ03719.1 hypothetical protein OX958_27565 [Kribbella sp. CA-293567]